MKGIRKLTGLIVALMLCVGLLAACGGTTETTKYALTVNGGTGGGSYDTGTQVTATATVPDGKAFVAWLEGETEVSTANPYTFTLSKNTTLTATFTPADDNGGEETNLTKLVVSNNMTYDKTTKLLRWTTARGVSYEITIKDPSGTVVDTYIVTTDSILNDLNLSSLNWAELPDTLTAVVIAKGDGVTTADSDPKEITLANNIKNDRMQAFATWETGTDGRSGFRAKVSTSLSIGESFRPSVNEITAVDIKASETPNKSIVTVFGTYIQGGSISWGKVAYEIDTVAGATYQDKLNDVSSKIVAGNIVEDSNKFMVIGNLNTHVMKDLSAGRILPSELIGYVKIITDNVSDMTKSGNNYYISFGGLVDMGGGQYFNIMYDGHLVNSSSLTLNSVSSRISDGDGTITLNSKETYTGTAEFMALKDEYKAWL